MEPPRLLFELLCSQILLISALLVVEYKEKGVGVELLKYGRVKQYLHVTCYEGKP